MGPGWGGFAFLRDLGVGTRDPGTGMYEYTWYTCVAPWCSKLRKVRRKECMVDRGVWECRYSTDVR